MISACSAFRTMAFSPDERLLVTGSDDGEVRVWDVRTGLQLYLFSHSREGVVPFVGADFIPAGDHVVSWDSNGERRVWAIEPLQGDLFQTACRLLPFENGVRELQASDDPDEVEATGDPCENVTLQPQWGSVLGFVRN